MALVQVKGLFRFGLVQKVGRFVSPPNPSSTNSFLWKSDSFSMQKRALMMARMRSFKMNFFSSTPAGTVAAAEIHSSPILEAEAAREEDVTSSVTSAGAVSSETDSSQLDKTYGEEQVDPHKVAESTHDHHMNTKDDEEPETLETTGFDLSKMTRPVGGE